MKRGAVLGLLIAMPLVTNAPTARADLNTFDSWDRTSFISAMGEMSTSTYGQTFTVGTETVLNSFTFALDDLVNPDVVDFEAYVMEWNGWRATGPVLFQSSAMSTTNNGGADGWEYITIHTNGLHLISGSKYVAFFTAANQYDGSYGNSKWGYTWADVVSGGDFVYMNNDSDFSRLTMYPWDLSHQDLAFSMDFSPVPAPGAVLLGVLGLGTAGMKLRRRFA